jgi:hypothetical protein
MAETIDITPNYSVVTEQFLHDTEGRVRSAIRKPEQAQLLHDIMGSLNVALQAVDTVEALKAFRERIDALTVEVAEKNRKFDDTIPYRERS